MKKALNNKHIIDFKLVELILTIAFIALSLTLAVPGFQEIFALK